MTADGKTTRAAYQRAISYRQSVIGLSGTGRSKARARREPEEGPPWRRFMAVFDNDVWGWGRKS